MEGAVPAFSDTSIYISFGTGLTTMPDHTLLNRIMPCLCQACFKRPTFFIIQTIPGMAMFLIKIQ